VVPEAAIAGTLIQKVADVEAISLVIQYESTLELSAATNRISPKLACILLLYVTARLI